MVGLSAGSILPLACSVIAVSASDYRLGPVIGIVSAPSEKHKGLDVIPKSYVDWVQAAGGRVMPLPSGVMWDKSTANWTAKPSNVWTPAQYEERFNLLNGLLLLGGNPWSTVASQPVRQLLKLSRRSKDEYFPVWGTCAGFEAMVILSTDSCQATVMDGNIPADSCKGPVTYGWDTTNVSLPQKLTQDGFSSRLFGSADSKLVEAMESQPLAANFHRASVIPSEIDGNAQLSSSFRILSTSVDSQGREFVSAIEGKTFPWYGTQWHPEKPAGEWGMKNGLPYENINHGPEAVRLGQHLANVLVSEASRSSHGVGQDAVINPMLIINDVPRAYDTKHPLYLSTYTFNWTTRTPPSIPSPQTIIV